VSFYSSSCQTGSCDSIKVLTSTKKKVPRVLARRMSHEPTKNHTSAFSDKIRNNSKKDKTKTSRMVGWIESRPKKFLNQISVCQGLLAKCKSVRFRFISLMYVRQVRLTSHESKPHKKHNSPNKHHHHGGGAANPCSGVDLMNPHRPRGGRPSANFFQSSEVASCPILPL
jgi:hypothetical protein